MVDDMLLWKVKSFQSFFYFRTWSLWYDITVTWGRRYFRKTCVFYLNITDFNAVAKNEKWSGSCVINEIYTCIITVKLILRSQNMIMYNGTQKTCGFIRTYYFDVDKQDLLHCNLPKKTWRKSSQSGFGDLLEKVLLSVRKD